MALRPQVTLCVQTGCSDGEFVDTRGAYHAVNNPYGWGTPNMQGNQVTSATITFQNLTDESDAVEYDVLDQIPDTVTGDITFELYEYDFEDGIYEITYTLEGTENVTKTFKQLVLCNSRCCIDKMWAKIIEYRNTKTSEAFDKYIYSVLKAEALYEGIRASGGCLQLDAAEEILELIETICNFENCNC